MGGKEGLKRLYEGKPRDGVLENEQEFASGQEDGQWTTSAEDSMRKGMFGASESSVLFKITSEVGGVRKCGQKPMSHGPGIQVVIGGQRRLPSRKGTRLPLHFRTIMLCLCLG